MQKYLWSVCWCPVLELNNYKTVAESFSLCSSISFCSNYLFAHFYIDNPEAEQPVANLVLKNLGGYSGPAFSKGGLFPMQIGVFNEMQKSLFWVA